MGEARRYLGVGRVDAVDPDAHLLPITHPDVLEGNPLDHEHLDRAGYTVHGGVVAHPTHEGLVDLAEVLVLDRFLPELEQLRVGVQPPRDAEPQVPDLAVSRLVAHARPSWYALAISTISDSWSGSSSAAAC